jgi:hypothetical protein
MINLFEVKDNNISHKINLKHEGPNNNLCKAIFDHQLQEEKEGVEAMEEGLTHGNTNMQSSLICKRAREVSGSLNYDPTM